MFDIAAVRLWLDAESFADLTRIMTVERPVAAEWTRTAECGTSEEQRDFGRDLARHFGRFAFPDDFTKAMRALRNRIIKKEPTGGAEGLALQRVCDIRAAADPDWLSGSIHVTITFLVKVGTLVPLSKDLAEAPPDAATVEWLGSARTPANIASRLMDGIHDASTNSLLWDALGHAWVDFCQPHGSIISVTALVIPFDEITVAEYLKTDRVDLEYLSSSVGD